MLKNLSIGDVFSFKAFGFGLIAVAGVYGLIFAYLALNSSPALTKLEAQLASQTVLIDRIVQQPEVQISEEQASSYNPDQSASLGDDLKALNARESAEETEEDILARQTLALREAPIEGFFENSVDGPLPITKPSGQTPFDVYRKPHILNLSKPFIAIAVQDFGLSPELSEKMVQELPSTVTFLLNPYSDQPDQWTKFARADGHEVWLNLPIETNAFPLRDPGAKGLLTRVSLQYNQDRLQWLLSRASGYAGIAAFTDSALNNAKSVFENTAKSIFERGLAYFELNISPNTFFKPLADNFGVPAIQNAAVIDIVDPQLPQIKAVVSDIKTRGGAIIVVEPSPRNIANLARWIAVLEKRDIVSIPLSAIAAPDTERN